MTQARRNLLGGEKSPYLLQHKDNPVHWFPWGEEAFQTARRENKPIFLSIGYSTCHWCHVMEHDSFEHREVADVLNDAFVSIKVDREERPDVDQLYMDAVVAQTGHGGWPLSVFLTPLLKPFFGGTFFPQSQFVPLLSRVAELWQSEPDKIEHSAQELTHALQTSPALGSQGIDEELLKKAFAQFEASFDARYGGFGTAPKFPRSMDLSLLLRIHRRTSSDRALAMVTTTLDHMARGGIYDHLGGGFHRYSTDAKWLVPHFEKMLYDNALLATTYLEAFQVTANTRYAAVAKEILNYILRDMTHPEGGFYSAEDADSDGKEGKFYVWTERELEKSLSPEEFSLFSKTYGVTAHGNFENATNILRLGDESAGSIEDSTLLKSAAQKLLKIRETRIHPHKDDKILTSWNGLMIAALAKGHQVLREPRFLIAAERSAHFVKRYLFTENILYRRFRDGESRFHGALEDYAFLIHGLLSLYESNFDPHWVEFAETLQAVQDERFWDRDNYGYYASDVENTELIFRKKDSADGAIPSGNSLSALNLERLYGLTSRKRYKDKAEATLAFLAPHAHRYPLGFSQALIACDYYLDRSKEIAILGSRTHIDTQHFIRYLYQQFFPNQVIAFRDPEETIVDTPVSILHNRPSIEGKTTLYICEQGSCQTPISNLEEAKAALRYVKTYTL